MNNFIVPTNVAYSSYILNSNLNTLYRKFPFLDIKSVGVSNLGNPINVIRLGTGNKKIFYSASFHANEWITSVLLMKFIEDYCNAYVSNSKIYNYSVQDLFNSCSIYIMPMVNPDGVTISQYGPKKIRNATLRKNLYKIANGFSFKEWKANARGVDINRNYAEGFNREGAKAPAHKNYPGKTPVSEPETKAQISVVEKVKPNVVICYHQAGKVMYHLNHTKLSNMLYSMTHYTHVLSGQVQYGTFSDYLDDRNILNCTLETGLVPAPVKNRQYKKIYKTNKNVLVAVAKMYS